MGALEVVICFSAVSKAWIVAAGSGVGWGAGLAANSAWGRVGPGVLSPSWPLPSTPRAQHRPSTKFDPRGVSCLPWLSLFDPRALKAPMTCHLCLQSHRRKYWTECAFSWLAGKKAWLALLPPPQPWPGHGGWSEGGVSGSSLIQGRPGKGTLKIGPQRPCLEDRPTEAMSLSCSLSW